jgi:hypothetical protein
MKKSGRGLNFRHTEEGSSYTKVKKWLKKYIGRVVRRRLNNSAE